MTKLMKSVKKAVLESAKIMQSEPFSLKTKGLKEDIITSNDTKIQEFLCSRLKKIIPNSEFLGEENITVFKESEYVWIVDPIDGTTNYSRGIRDCAISVGLERKGELILGVVYLPYNDELFTAEKGQGAYLNGKMIHVSKEPFEKGILCTAFSLYKKSLANACINMVQDVYAECLDFRRFGSAAAELCYLAAGRCDLYFEIRVFPWDFAGALVVLNEAGGQIAGLNNGALSLRGATPVIAANTKENLDKMIYYTNKYIKEIPYNE